uniref:ORF3 protein n=1 Tax=Bat Coronavirus PaGZ19 TaxID=3018872 RepID=A0AA49EDB5_9NIDO|nr:ORF3 protein [Bat Coronavirus PaGZ19]WCC62329.1 ORF3 protein [Bat Coronavirus PaGZ19]
MLGFFQLTIDHVKSAEVSKACIPDRPHSVPVYHFNLGIDYLFSSLFVFYFATYRGSSFKVNVLLLICRILVLFCYAPLLLYAGAYIDGCIIALVLFCRHVYVAYYCVRYRSFYFLLLNCSTLAWIFGKPWYIELTPYTCLRGGDSYVSFGPHFIPFVRDENLYIAIRGRQQLDSSLVRRIELINGDFLYIFAKEPVVSVVNIFYSK